MPKHDKEQNLNAGLLTEEDGQDAATREAIVRRLAPRQVNLVGNFADLQRGGGKVATGQTDSMADGVELPAGVTESDAKATVKAEKVADELVADVTARVDATARTDADIKASKKDAADKK